MAPPSDPKAVLLRYLTVAHDAVLWKIAGLTEYDLRRPLTPTGTNLLGLVKHLAWVELGYFGDVFDRPHGLDLPDNEDDPTADLYARSDESVEDVLALFGQARAHATETIEALDLAAEGHVPWWGDNNPVSLQLIVVHMTTEFHRHLGQIDILREGIDGLVGLSEDGLNTDPGDDPFWPGYHAKLEEIAAAFRSPSPPPDAN